MDVIKYKEIENKIIAIRNQRILIDSDVAELYDVDTKRVNEAVVRNAEKFPAGYVIELTVNEKNELVANCDRFNNLKHSTVLPKAFTEKGLYMLATILKSPKAVEATIGIIDTFAAVRQLNRTVHQVQTLPENSPKQKILMEQAGELMSNLLFADEDLSITGSETTYEMNLALFKVKKTIKKGKN